MADSLTQNEIVIFLLYADLESDPAYTSLDLDEFSRLSNVLKQQELEFQDLVEASTAQQVAQEARISHARLQWLLNSDRRAPLRNSRDRWKNQNIWAWVLGDRNFPESDLSDVPPILFGVGNKGILNSKGLAIFGPDSIPDRRIDKACTVAASAAEKGHSIILAGHLKMSKKILSAVEKQTGQVVWILPHRHQNQQLKILLYQMIRNHRLVVITAQSPDARKESNHRSAVGSLAAGLAEELLYVDGSNSRLEHKKRDQFETTTAALQHSGKCRLLLGAMISPKGRTLRQNGIQSWGEEPESGRRDR